MCRQFTPLTYLVGARVGTQDKIRRRFVGGLNEVGKNALRGRLKLVCVAPDIEKSGSDGPRAPFFRGLPWRSLTSVAGHFGAGFSQAALTRSWPAC